MSDGVVIVGGGQAAASAMRKLRDGGFAGTVTLVSEEEEMPYERPPLSKPTSLGPQFTPAASRWELAGNERALLGARAVAIDRERRDVLLESGETLRYGRLLLATGGRPRLLGIPGAQDVLYLRTTHDARRLQAGLGRCAQARQGVLIVGASWVGLEVAACCRAMDVAVTIIDPADRLCARTLPLSSSVLLQSLHTAAGVQIRLGAGLEALEPGVDCRLAHLSDGSRVDAGLVLAGIGIEPNDALARKAGLGEGPGIPVDGDGRTRDPRIFAAGDVAVQDCAWHGRAMRQETWNNANVQAARAAQVMAAELSDGAVAAPAAQRQLPWFWSEQYGHDFQVLGAPLGADMSIAVDTPSPGALQVFLRKGRVTGVVSLDRPREMRQLRKTLATGDVFSSHFLQSKPV